MNGFFVSFYLNVFSLLLYSIALFSYVAIVLDASVPAASADAIAAAVADAVAATADAAIVTIVNRVIFHLSSISRPPVKQTRREMGEKFQSIYRVLYYI